MQSNSDLVSKKSWLSKATVLALFAGSLSACAPTAEQPDVVVVPTPQPTVTVTVTATPQPTTTVIISPTPQATTVVVPTAPISDLAIINTTANRQSLINRGVQLTNAKVQSVVGDRTFWVGANNTQRVFVVLAPNLDAGTAEKKVVVKPGQTLDLVGVLKPAPSVEQAQKQWKGLTATEAQGLKNQIVYLEADQIKFK
ncbi:MAG: hypothetical protein KME32_03015 [Mojavia pulchra JT2-VF2]|jgi:hypothetical protein|uniref:DUF5666 domain-containing protein n=1 Tax=Mojavia pulchra JT2-VF2 TaxID=287848 RepID=A0A951PUI2_9NOST|nr:hypothetical protein [Mojavia pulchra JT2-VF2]